MAVLHNDIRTARKEHKCSFCGGTIEKGERYRNTAFIYEDEVQTQKAHTHCYDVFSELCRYYDEWGSDVVECDFDNWFSEYALDELSEEQYEEFKKLDYPHKWKYINDFINKNKKDKENG